MTSTIPPDDRQDAPRDALDDRLDASLRRIASPPAGLLDRCLAQIDQEQPASALPLRSTSSKTWPRVLALAACLGLLATLTYVVYFTWQAGRSNNGYDQFQYVVVTDVYDNARNNGFKPDWLCETDEEFRQTFVDRYAQPLQMAKLPDDRAMSGLSYLARGRGEAVYMIGTVNGKPVLVFFDRQAALDFYDLKPPQGLNRFEATVGSMHLYEFTPLDEPSFLPFLYTDAD